MRLRRRQRAAPVFELRINGEVVTRFQTLDEAREAADRIPLAPGSGDYVTVEENIGGHLFNRGIRASYRSWQIPSGVRRAARGETP